MASEDKFQMSPTSELAQQEDKDAETLVLEECPVVNQYDKPSPEDEFPEGGLVAWATVFGS